MNALRSLWREERPVLISGVLFALAGIALGLLLPLPATAASDPVIALERDTWLWLTWPAWLAALALLVSLRVRVVNARERRGRADGPPLRVVRRYDDEHPPLVLPRRPGLQRRPERLTPHTTRRPVR